MLMHLCKLFWSQGIYFEGEGKEETHTRLMAVHGWNMQAMYSAWFQAGFPALCKGTSLRMQENTFASRSSSFHPLNLIILDQRGINAEVLLKSIHIQTSVLLSKVSLRHLCPTGLNTSAPRLTFAFMGFGWGERCIAPWTRCRPFCWWSPPSSHCFLTSLYFSFGSAALLNCVSTFKKPWLPHSL